ncbi:MAG: hypothetical protein ACYTHK_11585 [Planctomycetota bacterium]|jgi:hypothetical protein
MKCIVCGGHSTWERTVFKGMEPTRVRLCDACQAKVQADARIARIKDAPDKDAKMEAIDEFLRELGVSPSS